MTSYECIFIVDDLSDDAVQAIYSAHDALVAEQNGISLLTITAQGGTPEDAARSVIGDLQDKRGLVRVRELYAEPTCI